MLRSTKLKGLFKPLLEMPLKQIQMENTLKMFLNTILPEAVIIGIIISSVPHGALGALPICQSWPALTFFNKWRSIAVSVRTDWSSWP